MIATIRFLALLAALFAAPAVEAACHDLRKSEPRHLSGLLTFRIFPGPPNYEDVQKGDTPEPGYVLKLDQAICLTGDAEFADPDQMFDEVHLVETEQSADDMKTLRDRYVEVDLERPMPAMTGHHHRPLVAWVTSIRPVSDPTELQGTAATTVEAFYRALESGDGALAAGFIIPEKTRKGAFSPAALTRFYGNLVEPLQLLEVKVSGHDQYRVRYRFRGDSGICDGRAMVSTTERGGRNYIKAIRAESGC